jgi:LysR substrate binding domain
MDRQVDLAVLHTIARGTVQFRGPSLPSLGSTRSRRGSAKPVGSSRRVRLGDLMNERWTLPIADAPYRAVVFEAFRANGLQVPRTVVASTLPVRGALLATGRYLSMVPRVVLQFPTPNQALRALKIDLPTTVRPLALITLKNRTLNLVANFLVTGRRRRRNEQET